MVTITCLSNEVISIILGYVNISIKDVVNFASTCNHFHNMIYHDNVLWQNKLYQRWPENNWLKTFYDNLKCKEHINFVNHMKASMKCTRELWHYVMQMSKMHFHKDDLCDSDMKDFNSLFHLDKNINNNMNYYFLICEVTNFIAQSSRDSNLTHLYYIKKLHLYLRQCHFKYKWEKFLNYSDKQQLLEQAATIVAQWYQPRLYISYSFVKRSLANIAQRVLECLKKKHPTHSIFSTSTELFSFWEHNNIDDNHWDSIEGRQLIDTLRQTLFDEIGFSVNLYVFIPTNPEVTGPEKVLIDLVLKKKVGNTVSLGIIFQSVARRLGIRCDLISFPSHFFLSWKSKYNTTNPKDEECFYIDVLHHGSILSRNDCPRIRGAKKCPIENFNTYDKIGPIEVMLRIIHYLQTTNPRETGLLLELQHLIKPDNIDTIAQLGHHYMHHNMNLSDLMVKLTKIQNNCKNSRSAEVRRAEIVLDKFRKYTERLLPYNNMLRQRKRERTKEMTFKIGMIVTCHDRLTSRSLSGVIIGWDETFNAEIEVEWRQCIRPLYNGPISDPTTLLQPFYKVLCTENKAFYVIEDVIKRTLFPVWIEHKEIGRYFYKYESDNKMGYYVPNEMLAEQYQCDLC